MPNNRLSRWVVTSTLILGLAAGAAAAQGQSMMADSFASVIAAAMARMDHGMMAPATGDADRDFATMMIPHHQGAVEMAEAELRFGHDPVLRRLAQGIIVEQRQEIVVMHQAIAALPAASPPTRGSMPTHKDH